MKNNTVAETFPKESNSQDSNFLYTNKGPIAKLKGIWYSVNGTADDIMDVRYALKEQELNEFGIHNEIST